MRFKLRPALCDRFGARDQCGMRRWIKRIVLDDLAHRRRIAEPALKAGHDETFEVRRRNAPAFTLRSLTLGN